MNSQNLLEKNIEFFNEKNNDKNHALAIRNKYLENVKKYVPHSELINSRISETVRDWNKDKEPISQHISIFSDDMDHSNDAKIINPYGVALREYPGHEERCLIVRDYLDEKFNSPRAKFECVRDNCKYRGKLTHLYLKFGSSE